jgi:hypothetical protein
MTLEELGAMLTDLEETRRVAQAELGSIGARRERVEALESDRDDLLDYVADIVPEELDELTGQQRNQLYRMLCLEVIPFQGGYEVKGAFCTLGVPPSRTPKATTSNSTSHQQASQQFSRSALQLFLSLVTDFVIRLTSAFPRSASIDGAGSAEHPTRPNATDSHCARARMPTGCTAEVPTAAAFFEGRLRAADEDARGEDERAAEDDLKRRHDEAHIEVAVADEGDGEQLEAYDAESHVERQADVRYEERQGVQDAPDERGDAGYRSS